MDTREFIDMQKKLKEKGPDDGGPAFPATWRNNTSKTYQVGDELVQPGAEVVCLGISVRDYFAAQALAAMIGHESKEGSNRGEKSATTLPAFAYEYADAMLKARKQ